MAPSSRYADHASWFEGDERVTLYNWSDAGRRLDLINRALAVFVDESAGECAVNFDGDACFSAVGRAMLVLSNAKESEAVAVTEKILRVGGPAAGEAVASWCESHRIRAREGHLAACRRRVRPRGVPGVFVLEQRRWILPPRCRGGVPGVPRRGRGVRGDGGRRADDDELDGSRRRRTAVAAVLDAGRRGGGGGDRVVRAKSRGRRTWTSSRGSRGPR